MGGIKLEDGLLAFGLTMAAGLSTTIGAAVVFNERLAALANKKFLAGSLATAAGVMMYVSFVEILSKSSGGFEDAGNSASLSSWLAFICFFAGIGIGNLLDTIVHRISGDVHQEIDFDKVPGAATRSAAPPGVELKDLELEGQEGGSTALALSESTEEQDKDGENGEALTRMGMMTALAIGIHNFPEGLATFVGTLDDPAVGASLALAIAIHNIPEGLCVAIPIYYANGDRWQAFKWAFISGISEPIGAALGWLVLYDVTSDTVYGLVFGLVGGMMVNICIHELIPTAFKYDPHDEVTSKAFIFGMLIMGISLCLFV